MIVLRRTFVILVGFLGLSTVGLLVYSFLTIRLRRQVQIAEWEARQFGQYTLEEKIGQGSMGIVYRARHALLRRPTAIKLLPPDSHGSHSVARFEREVQLTSQLTHPNTIQIYDYGHTPDGIFYYAMEFLDGIDLRHLVASNGPLPEARIHYLLIHICLSLGEAHQVGLVHRDIKPANIFLGKIGGEYDFVKVLDFGLVRPIQDSGKVTRSERVAEPLTGTPAYMAPEVINNPDRVDPRSDIYALGALAYFLACGNNVFEGNNVDEIFHQQLHATPIPPSQRYGTLLQPSFEKIMMQCLEKDPDQRPQTVRDLAVMLERCAGVDRWSEEKARAWWLSCRPPASPGQAPAAADAEVAATDPTLRISMQER